MKTDKTTITEGASGIQNSAMTTEQRKRMMAERYYCAKCDRSHHIFQFGPSSTRKIAVCGTVFPLIKGE